jgi:hypothetical protein
MPACFLVCVLVEHTSLHKEYCNIFEAMLEKFIRDDLGIEIQAFYKEVSPAVLLLIVMPFFTAVAKRMRRAVLGCRPFCTGSMMMTTEKMLTCIWCYC